jgi:phosphoglycolate phosphatase
MVGRCALDAKIGVRVPAGQQMIKNVIFDFDGVIADTFDVNWALSQEHDPSATLEDFLAHHDGNVFTEPRIKFNPEQVHLFYSEYANRLTSSHIERSAEPLKNLGAKYKLYIISSNGEYGIKKVLEQAGILPLFVKILGVETHKSKVEKFKILIEQEGITPNNTVFVTDTLGDIKEAHKVGIRTIAETFGFHDRQRLVQGNPYKVVDSWKEIEEAIKNLE